MLRLFTADCAGFGSFALGVYSGGGGGFYSGGMSMEDIFSQFGDIFGGHFDFGGGFGGATGGRGGSRRRPSQTRSGSDVRIKVKLTLEEISKGVSKKLKLPIWVKCDHCNGTGAKDGTAFNTCPTCHGTGTVRQVVQSLFGAQEAIGVCPQCEGEGKVISENCHYCNGEGIQRKEEIVAFDIPAGVQDGQTLTMRGKGNAAPHGGANGDLLIVIEEVKHPELIRDGNDIVYNLMLDLPTATLGGSVEVPTISGRARLKIPAGTQPGKVLRLRGKGLPSTDGYGAGDELVNVMVYIPENIGQQEKDAIESLRGKPGVTPDESTKNRIFSKLRHIFE